MQEARPGICRFKAENSVELGGVADGLVQLQRDLLRVDDDVHHAGGALRRLEQRRRLLADAGRLVREPEPEHELPARLRAQPAECARVAPLLCEVVPDSRRVDSRTGLDQLLLDVGAFGGDEHLVLELRARERLRNLDLGPRKPLLRIEAEVDLLVERDGERVDLDACPERAGLRVERLEPALAAAGRAREVAGSPGCVAAALVAERAGAGEAPGAVDEHAHADPLRLDVADRLDVAVLRRDGLRALEDAARVGVRSAGADRGVDRIPADVPHGAGRYTAHALERWWRNW